MKQSREVQAILGGTVLYIIFSFFDWQQVSFSTSFGGGSYGYSEWSGFGIIAALVAIVLLVWEIARLVNFQVNLGSLSPGQISAGLALLLLLTTIITFLTHGTARHWPAYIGLLLSLVIAGAAFMRAKAEGVTMPEMPKNISVGGTGGGGGSMAPPPPSGSDNAPPASDSTDV